MIRLDSSGNDASDSGVVGTLIILGLLFANSCSKWVFWSLLRAVLLCSISSPSLIMGLRSGSHSECILSCISQL